MYKYLFLLLSFLASDAFSADYVWSAKNLTSSSPSELCSRYASTRSTQVYTVKCSSVTRVSNTSYTGCLSQTNHDTGATFPLDGACFSINRSGDSCPVTAPQFDPPTGDCIPPPCNTPGQVWDPSIGFCVTPDPCVALSGQSTGFKASGNSNQPNPFYQPVGNTFVTPNFVTSGPAGCNAVVQPGVKCRVYGNGDYVCKGNATYDGQKPAPGDSNSPPADPCLDEADCLVPPPDPNTTNNNGCTNWVHDAEGRRTRTCESTTTTTQPGNGSCLTSGALVCVKPSPTPVTKTTATSSNQTQTTDPATGNTTIKNGDTITTTICKAGACNTTTTTNNTTTIKNPSGDTIGQSGNCSGPGCASSTNPDANGDGLGDCLTNCGDDEEEQPQKGSASASKKCDTPPPCEGDHFQCSILLQVHYNSCEERRPFTAEEKQQVEDQITANITANDAAQTDLDNSLGGYFAEFKQASTVGGGTGGQCLPDKTFPFIGSTITLPFSLVCPYLELFRIALIAVAYLAAARTIHTQI